MMRHGRLSYISAGSLSFADLTILQDEWRQKPQLRFVFCIRPCPPGVLAPWCLTTTVFGTPVFVEVNLLWRKGAEANHEIYTAKDSLWKRRVAEEPIR